MDFSILPCRLNVSLQHFINVWEELEIILTAFQGLIASCFATSESCRTATGLHSIGKEEALLSNEDKVIFKTGIGVNSQQLSKHQADNSELDES